MKLPAIIIARGGSKRIPKKNVKDFCGKPLVEWSIIQAQEAEGASPIVLSTDDDEIASIGQRCGVVVLRRPVMPDNTAGSVVFDIAIDQLRDMGYKFDAFISLLATGPLRLPGDISLAMKMYYEFAYPVKTQLISGVKFVVAIHIPIDENDYIRYKPWYYKSNEIGVLDTGLFSICDVKTYRQVLQKVHDDPKHLIKTRKKVQRIHPYSVFYLTKPWQATDIDCPAEFEFAEILFKHYILDKGYYQ